MIKAIDDLRKCYAARADKEVFELLMDKCEELGVKWSGGGAPRACLLGEAVVFSGVDHGKLTHGCLAGMKQRGYKRLTLSDFKPTRAEYVQVTESIFDLRDSLESGELHERHVESIKSTSLSEGSGVTYGYTKITSKLDLFKLAANGDAIYRRVEKVVDERQEFVETCLRSIKACNSDDPSYYSGWFEQLYDSGCRFVRANGEIE